MVDMKMEWLLFRLHGFSMEQSLFSEIFAQNLIDGSFIDIISIASISYLVLILGPFDLFLRDAKANAKTMENKHTTVL
jgi:hypothetical protein